MKRKNPSIIWCSMHTYRWASKRWKSRDVRIDNYISNLYINVARPRKDKLGYKIRRVKIDHQIAAEEHSKWLDGYNTPKALRNRK